MLTCIAQIWLSENNFYWRGRGRCPSYCLVGLEYKVLKICPHLIQGEHCCVGCTSDVLVSNANLQEVKALEQVGTRPGKEVNSGH